ncbi:hypothetical protein OH687_09745 [Burkholderia anthina]|nr:hypothetical protein OH687_09745 [Burkholderia anthina]
MNSWGSVGGHPCAVAAARRRRAAAPGHRNIVSGLRSAR